MEGIRGAVLEVLMKHPDGVSRDQLMLTTGYEDRAIRRAVRDLRREHYPIGNGGKAGYTFGANAGLRKTIADMRCKALDQLTTAAALEKCLTIDGQETIKGLS